MITNALARHLREVYLTGNWTSTSLKKELSEVSLTEATRRVENLNTLLRLAYHIHYYLRVQMRVLRGGPLEGHDRFSFDHPELKTEAEWQEFLQHLWIEIEQFAELVEALPDDRLHQSFADPKYGTLHRNLVGFLEHTNYHLGQIVMIKKLLQLPNDQ